MAIDFSRYVTPGTPLGSYDYGRGFRALAQQQLQEKTLAENARQADQREYGQQKRHDDSMSFNRESLGSQNDRFSLELEDTKEQRGQAADAKRAQMVSSGVQAFREKVAKTDFSGADSMIGTLTEMGVNVQRTVDPKTGQPNYRVKAPAFGERPGIQTAASIRSQIGNEDTGAGQQPIGEISGTTELPPVEPIREISGSTEIYPNDSADSNSANQFIERNNPFAPSALKNATPVETSSDPSQKPTEPKNNPFDPYALNTSEMMEQNRRRSDPMLSGIVGATPGRFQGRMKNLMTGVREMGLPLQGTMETLQKPMDTMAGLMKGEMSAEAARARMTMSQSNQGFNRNIRLEDRMWRRLDGIGKSFDLPNIKQRIERTSQLTNLLDQHNPSADGLLISELRGMFESGVMTDKDFKNAKAGIKPVLQQIMDFGNESIMGTGLNPDSRAGIKAFLRQKGIEDNRAIQNAQNQLMTQVQRAGSEEELKTAYDYIAGNIPQNLWADEIKEAYGIPVDKKTGSVDRSGNYSTNNNPGTQESSVTIDLNAEAEELLQ